MPEPKTCPPDHKHELTHTCYSHGCRCDPCREAHARTARERRKLKAYGRFDHGFVPGEPVREHIAYLRSQGMGVRTIGQLSGVHPSTLGAIMWGRNGNPPSTRVRRDNAEAVLAVRPSLDGLADGAMIDPTPTRRRIQALAYMGWTWRAIATHAGIDERRIHWFLEGQLITAGNARLIRDVYSQLWDKTPPARNAHVAAKIRLAKEKARRFGWTGPMGWDDIDKDPEPVEIEPEDRLHKGWVLDELDMLREAGESAETAVAALRRNVKSTASLAYRHGRPDLGRWLEEAA